MDKLKEGQLYRWVVTPTSPLYVDGDSIIKCPGGSHQSLAKRLHLYGRILGGFLEIKGEEIKYAGGAMTVERGNRITMFKAIEERGLVIVD